MHHFLTTFMDAIRVNGHHKIYIPDYKYIYIYIYICVCVHACVSKKFKIKGNKFKIKGNVDHWE